MTEAIVGFVSPITLDSVSSREYVWPPLRLPLPSGLTTARMSGSWERKDANGYGSDLGELGSACSGLGFRDRDRVGVGVGVRVRV